MKPRIVELLPTLLLAALLAAAGQPVDSAQPSFTMDTQSVR